MTITRLILQTRNNLISNVIKYTRQDYNSVISGSAYDLVNTALSHGPIFSIIFHYILLLH